MQYLLPCTHCESKLTVQPKDAGRELPCPNCGSPQKLPSMGAMRQLEPAPGQPANSRRDKKWSILQGACFGLGMLCLISGIIGLYIYVPKLNATLNEMERIKSLNGGTLPDVDNLAQFQAVFEKMPADQLWEQWREALKINLDRWFPSELRFLLDNYENERNGTIAFSGLMLLGIVAMGTSFFLP